MPYTRAKVNSYFLETTLRVTSFFEFFLSAHRARIKKVVRATVLRDTTTTSLSTTTPPLGAWPA